MESRKLFDAVTSFFRRPASPRPVIVLRMGLATILLVRMVTLAPYVADLFGSRGLIQSPVQNLLVLRYLPRLAPVVEITTRIGIPEGATLTSLYLLLLLSLLSLILGKSVRVAAVTAWLLNLMFCTSGIASAYGVDQFINIALFYLAIGPTGDWNAPPTRWARTVLRMLQLHLCVVYLASGIEKASGSQWWTGEALWRALARDDLSSMDFRWLAYHPNLLRFGTWSTLAIELGYAVFVWPARTRNWMAAATILLHAGITFSMGLWFFGPTMALLSVCAWLIPDEVRSPDASPSPDHWTTKGGRASRRLASGLVDVSG